MVLTCFNPNQKGRPILYTWDVWFRSGFDKANHGHCRMQPIDATDCLIVEVKGFEAVAVN